MDSWFRVLLSGFPIRIGVEPILNGRKVLMGNDVAYKVIGIETIQIKMHDGLVRTLTDVRHVSELKKNLISLRTFYSNGCIYKATDGVLKISKGSLIMMKWKKINGLSTLKVAWL